METIKKYPEDVVSAYEKAFGPVNECEQQDRLMWYEHLGVFMLGWQAGMAHVTEKMTDTLYLDDLPAYCQDCGNPLELVRPGKWQCNNPECPSNSAG